MKYFKITYYKKNADRLNHANYKGVDYIQRPTEEEAETFAKQKKNCEYVIEEISKETYELFEQF